MADTDRQVIPCNECLSYVVYALGIAFQEWSLPVFQRCCRMIEANLLANATGMTMPNGDPYDKDFLVCALDLVSGLCEGLEANFGTLAQNSNLLQHLYQCLSDDPGVRQSALALMGDMTKHTPHFLAPAVPGEWCE